MEKSERPPWVVLLELPLPDAFDVDEVAAAAAAVAALLLL
jgi:hypothetical protein